MSTPELRQGRRRTAPFALAIAVLALAGGGRAAAGTAEGPLLARWFLRAILHQPEAISGYELRELLLPLRPDRKLPSRIEWSGAVWVEVPAGGGAPGGQQQRLVRCVKRLSLADPSPACEVPESAVYFDLDDAAICPSGGCLAGELDAGGTGADYRAVLRHQSVFPPQDTKVVTSTASGVPAIVAREGDPMPEGGGATFLALAAVATAGPYVAYSGSGTGGRAGLYLYDPVGGTHAKVVDSDDARPRAPGNFDGARSIAMRAIPGGHEIAWSDSAGVYVTRADLTGPIEQPIAAGDSYGAGRALSSPFDSVSFWTGTDRVVVTAFSQFFTYGVYSASRAAPGAIARHGDGETPIPGGGGNFSAVQRGSAAGDTLFLEGFGPAGYLGIFADRDLADGAVEPVLLVGDTMPVSGGGTKTVQSSAVQRGSALAGGLGLFAVYFTDATSDVALAIERLLAGDFEEGDFSDWSSWVP